MELYLEFTRRPRKKGWQLEDALCPPPPESSEEGGKLLLGQKGRSGGFRSLLGVMDLHDNRLGEMETRRGSGGE